MSDKLATIIEWYQDPLFIAFPIITAALALGAFLLYGLPWTLLAWFDPEWATPYKVQKKPFNVRAYLAKNLWLISFNSSILFLLLILAWPLLRLSGVHMGEPPPWYTYVWQIMVFVFLDDFLYYWMHRKMHENKWLLKHVHSVHHQIRNPAAIAGNYFHWIELALTSAIAMIGPLLLSSHVYVVYLWFIWRQLEAVDGHSGYNFKWNPMRLFPFYHGPAFHDAHHETYKGNYAGFLPLLDRWFGTRSVTRNSGP